MRKMNLTAILNNLQVIRFKLAIVFLFFNYSLFANNYYVASNGSDSGNGSQRSPWLTIQHAVDIAEPGDTVFVESGIYKERIVSKKSGTSLTKIVIKSSPRRLATVIGFNLSHNYIRIEGFSITNDITGVNEDGIRNNGAHNEMVDNYLYNVKLTAINSTGDWAYVAENRIYKSQMGIVTSGKNWLVEKNDVERLFMYGTMDDCDYSRFFGENGTVRKNYFHGSTAAETDPAHLDCFQTYDVNGLSMKNITIEDNICLDCDQGVMATATKVNVSTDMLIKNNLFAHTLAWGVAVVGISNVRIINNTFYDIRVYGAGIRGKRGTDGIIKNNIFMNIGNQAYLIEDKSNIIDYNVTYNCGTPKVTGPHDIVNLKDPLFKDALKNDFHLLPGSPCIDSGDPAMSVPPCGGKRVDIGAFEKCQDKE